MSGFVTFVALDEIEPRSACAFDHEGQKVLIVRLDGDDIRAYDGRCPHQRARLPAGPLVDRAFIECASHGAIFRATDGALQPGPVTCPGLAAWPVRVQDGQVAVAVPEKPAIDSRGRPPAWGPSVRAVAPESPPPEENLMALTTTTTTTPAAPPDPRLQDGTSLLDLVDEAGGHVSRRIYADPEIFELEQERIFRRTWQFLAHETELKAPGEYITRNLAGEPILLIKGDDGEIRAFLNSCRHRGMRVCRADRDKVSFLRCPYHGWSYNKSGGLETAFAEELYDPGNLVKEELGLIPVTQVDSYRGLIFGTWDEATPPLREYLGDMTFYLDVYLGRTDGGTEVTSAPHVWDVRTNWKFAADNFTGDNFHLYTAHGSVVELGMLPPDPMSLSFGHLVTAQDGHVLHLVPGPPDPMFANFGLPVEMEPHFDRNLGPEQRQILRDHAWSVGTVFPNLSFMQVMVQGDLDSPMVPFLCFRTWEPRSATTTRITSWFLSDKEMPADFRQASYEGYVRTFGPSGIFEQDDMENWEDCTRVNSGKIAQRYGLHHGMGLHLEPDAAFIGPGKAYPGSYGERTQLAFYGEWQKWLTYGANAAGSNGGAR